MAELSRLNANPAHPRYAGNAIIWLRQADYSVANATTNQEDKEGLVNHIPLLAMFTFPSMEEGLNALLDRIRRDERLLRELLEISSITKSLGIQMFWKGVSAPANGAPIARV